MNLDIISTVILFLTIFIVFGRNILKSKPLNTSNSLFLLFISVFILLGVNDILFYLQKLSLFDFLKYKSMAIISLNAYVLTSFGLLAISDLTPKKLKTLWRIPILGLLLAFFDLEFHLVIQLGIGFITLLVYFLNRDELRILQGNIILHTLIVLALPLVGMFDFWVTNILLILFIINIAKFWDLMRLKQACTRIE